MIVASDAQPPTSAAEAGPSATNRETRAKVTNEGDTRANIEVLCTSTGYDDTRPPINITA